MRVITHPGTIFETARSLCNVMNPPGADTAVLLGLLIEKLVECGVLTLTDCVEMGAPNMTPDE